MRAVYSPQDCGPDELFFPIPGQPPAQRSMTSDNEWINRTNFYSQPKPYNKSRRPISVSPRRPAPPLQPVRHPPQQPLQRPAPQVIHRQAFIEVPGGKHQHDAERISATVTTHQRNRTSQPVVYHLSTNENGRLYETRGRNTNGRNYAFYDELLALQTRTMEEKRRPPPNNVKVKTVWRNPKEDPKAYYLVEQDRSPTQPRAKTYVQDIAGAHLPIYQRIGEFRGISRREAYEGQQVAEAVSDYFHRKYADTPWLGAAHPHRTKWTPQQQPRSASVTPYRAVANDISQPPPPPVNASTRGDNNVHLYATLPRRKSSNKPRPASTYYF